MLRASQVERLSEDILGLVSRVREIQVGDEELGKEASGESFDANASESIPVFFLSSFLPDLSLSFVAKEFCHSSFLISLGFFGDLSCFLPLGFFQRAKFLHFLSDLIVEENLTVRIIQRSNN